MPVQFYNTLSRKMEFFQPQITGEVKLYTCGPTVYNYPHIGNHRTYLFEDLLHRWLLYRGYHVRQVMNLTDVDDKTISNSIKQGMSLNEYTQKYKDAFFEDLKSLNITPAEHYPAATDYIEQMIVMITQLVEKGFAYQSDDGVYFNIASFANYGKLVQLDKDQLKVGASGRLTADEYNKDNLSDFALWKNWTPEDGSVKWDSPFGVGRPGWHIECSVMSMELLGETIDIHCGGVDNIFPHHENEIAQSEALTGKTFVKYWLHAAHLIVNGEKMAKSKGNFYTLRDLMKQNHSPRSIRYALMTSHYRKPLNFTFDLLRQSESSLKRIDDFLFMLKNIQNQGIDDQFLLEILDKNINKFETSLDMDLNIAEAIGVIFTIINEFYERQNNIDQNLAKKTIEFFNKIDSVLGFLKIQKENSLTDEEQNLIDLRQEAKREKNYQLADSLRSELLARGIELRDTKDGQVWKRI